MTRVGALSNISNSRWNAVKGGTVDCQPCKFYLCSFIVIIIISVHIKLLSNCYQIVIILLSSSWWQWSGLLMVITNPTGPEGLIAPHTYYTKTFFYLTGNLVEILRREWEFLFYNLRLWNPVSKVSRPRNLTRQRFTLLYFPGDTFLKFLKWSAIL